MMRPAAGGQTKKAAAENIDAILPLEKQDEDARRLPVQRLM